MQDQEPNPNGNCQTNYPGFNSLEALQVFLYGNYKPIFAIICGVLRDYDQGEAEHVFDKMLNEVAPKYYMYDSSKGNLLTWLKAIARKKAIDRLRHLERYSVTGFTDYNDQIGPIDGICTYHEEDENTQDGASKAMILHREINKLSSETQKIIRHVGLSNISIEDFAERTGISNAAAKSRYYRGIKKLREALLEYEEFSHCR